MKNSWIVIRKKEKYMSFNSFDIRLLTEYHQNWAEEENNTAQSYYSPAVSQQNFGAHQISIMAAGASS